MVVLVLMLLLPVLKLLPVLLPLLPPEIIAALVAGRGGDASDVGGGCRSGNGNRDDATDHEVWGLRDSL